MSTPQNKTTAMTKLETSQPTCQDIEKALIDVLKAGVSYHYPRDSKLIQEYKQYIMELRNWEDKEAHIRRIASMIFPGEDAYNNRMTRYRKWYTSKRDFLHLLKSCTNYISNCLKKTY